MTHKSLSFSLSASVFLVGMPLFSVVGVANAFFSHQHSLETSKSLSPGGARKSNLSFNSKYVLHAWHHHPHVIPLSLTLKVSCVYSVCVFVCARFFSWNAMCMFPLSQISGEKRTPFIFFSYLFFFGLACVVLSSWSCLHVGFGLSILDHS